MTKHITIHLFYNDNYKINKMFNRTRSFITDIIQTASETPFIQDVKKGGKLGLIYAVAEGVERESLRTYSHILWKEHLIGANIEYIMTKFDNFSKHLNYLETVTIMRNRLVTKLLSKIDKHSEWLDNEEVLLNTHFQNPQKLYVMELENENYYIGTSGSPEEDFQLYSDNICTNEFIEKNKPIKLTIYGEIASNMDELNKVYRLMAVHGIKLYKRKIVVNDDCNLDTTVIETYLLHEYKFTVDEIAQMKGLLPTTIQTHLDKCSKYNVHLLETC
jgi:predicted GIY-YIG superfamily endonuclease